MPQCWLLLQERGEKVREHRQTGIEREGVEIIFKKRDNTQIWGENILNKVWKDRNNVKRHIK